MKTTSILVSSTAASRAHAYLRSVIFRPYRRGCGPVFGLTLWDTYRTDSLGKAILRYRLTASSKRTRGVWIGDATELFAGEVFACSPMHAIDSDATVVSLMGFLTLRPGDTDSEYFANYTDAQREFCEQHAEALACEVQSRFCDENGNVIERS